MPNEAKPTTTIDLAEINTRIKQALTAEFGVDVGFKQIDRETALSYIEQVVLQRVKQRIRGKEERELFKQYKQEFAKRGIKFDR